MLKEILPCKLTCCHSLVNKIISLRYLLLVNIAEPRKENLVDKMKSEGAWAQDADAEPVRTSRTAAKR